jgi:hypothetical protein
MSWKSEAVKCRRVLVPQETKANVEELELVVVLHSWRADELDSYIGGSNGSDDHNVWNVPLCKKAIIDCAIREMRQTWGTENYDLYQRAIRTGDLFYGIHRSDRIYVASLFIREFGGKVSHYIITDQTLGVAGENYDPVEEETGYLYKKKMCAFGEVICPSFRYRPMELAQFAASRRFTIFKMHQPDDLPMLAAIIGRDHPEAGRRVLKKPAALGGATVFNPVTGKWIAEP